MTSSAPSPSSMAQMWPAPTMPPLLARSMICRASRYRLTTWYAARLTLMPPRKGSACLNTPIPTTAKDPQKPGKISRASLSPSFRPHPGKRKSHDPAPQPLAKAVSNENQTARTQANKKGTENHSQNSQKRSRTSHDRQKTRQKSKGKQIHRRVQDIQKRRRRTYPCPAQSPV